MEQKWKFEVFAETDGILAVLPFGEIKIEIRKNPAHVLRLKRIITQLEKISIENTKIFIEKIDKIVLRLSLCDTYSQ